MRQHNPVTEKRVHNFLVDLHASVTTDPYTRATFLAMHHHMGGVEVGAAQRAGLIRRNGHRWEWIGGAPTKRDAERVKDIRTTIQYNYR